MIKILPFLLIAQASFGQSFPGPPDSANTTAIHKSSTSFIAWATGGTLTRGFVNINDTTVMYDNSNRASYGTLADAFGSPNNPTVVSLGDSGVATLTFDYIIQDLPGFDFAVFENGFQDGYMEFAHVEVSSNGIDFVRFPSTTEIPLSPQWGNGTIGDCRYVNNLAGKYRANYGTPFDLSELAGSPNLDVQNITHVRLIDVVGDVAGAHTTVDSYGTAINDPFPTPYHSCGFDLDAVGIINGHLAADEKEIVQFTFSPNPARNSIVITSDQTGTIRLTDLNGKLLMSNPHNTTTTINLNQIQSGVYLLQFEVEGGLRTERLIVE